MNVYLVKLSRPDIANATRELSKGMKTATEVHMKGLMRLCKFELDTASAKLKLFPSGTKNMWELQGMCDASFAGDKDTRRSVTGYLI